MGAMRRTAPIALFDSGVGGLSVLRHIRAQLPHESVVYVADQAHVPYGPRPMAEIVQLSRAITRFLLSQQAKIVVIPCNTASAAALHDLRKQFPQMKFVGMEPAVKPAAQQTQSGKVGVLATMQTLSSERYASLMHRFAGHVNVLDNPCVGLVDLIEAGAVNEPDTKHLLQSCLQPMLAAGVDTVVLGCTHYPCVSPLIAEIVGTAVTIIDPAPAVARQTVRVLTQMQLLAPPDAVPTVRMVTTGEAKRFSRQLKQLIGYEGAVETAVWQNGNLNSLPNSSIIPV